MKYQHVVAFRAVGLHATGESLKLPNSTEGYDCILTQEPQPLLADADRHLAVASLLLNGLFSPEGLPSGSADERIVAATSQIQAERADRYRSASFIVLVGEGEVDDYNPKALRETNELVVCFDAIDKHKLREQLRPQVAVAVASIVISFPTLAALETDTDALVLYREDGKQVVSLTATVGGNAVLSRNVLTRDLDGAATTASALKGVESMGRVYLHIMQALLMHQDRLRAFLSAWMALECFVHKTFNQYSAEFFCRLGELSPGATTAFVDRIKTVMRDKYGIAVKFALIAGVLDPSASCSDLSDFKHAKKLRDSLSHGDEVAAGTLPLESVLGLLRKYIALHAKYSARR